MNSDDNRLNPPDELRERAEEIIREETLRSAENIDALSPEEARRMFHDLRVHQIELQMQNEELHRAQLELETSRARYFDLYDLAPVGYCTVGKTGLIVEANLTAATLLGVTRDKLVHQPFTHFIFREDQDTYYHYRKVLFETDAPQGCDVRMQKIDSPPFCARLEMTTTRETAGAPPVCRIVMSDTTERKRTEAERLQLKKTRSLNLMAGAIAHHFNNQLAAVIGNLEMTMEDTAPGDASVEKIKQALKAAHKAAELSGLMLTYLGQTTAKKEPVDLGEICSRNLPLLRATMPTAIRLETEIPPLGPTINGNANQIQLVLTHLITNAWESIAIGRGSIQLSVKTIPAEDIPKSRRYPIDWQPQESRYACLEVRDTGSGITEEDIEKIFDPFFTTKFTGRGLGLAVVLGILQVHLGAIAVGSNPGSGSVFRVFLPVLTEAIGRRPEKSALSPETRKAATGTVLLIEDQELVRRMLSSILTHLGFTVLEAKDGVEGVDIFRAHKEEIGLVLSDLTMPRMNGWEVIAALHTLSPGIRVILTSGHDMDLIMAEDHPEQPDAFLHKPFSIKELRDAIRQALAER